MLSAPRGAGLTLPHPFAARATAGQAHLRIMETTDIHTHLWPYDYYADRPVDTVGLARTTAQITAVRAEAANALLLDNGDFLQGNPMGDFIAYERGLREGDLHPVIQALNTVGFDASTLGNHEFNYGLEFLEKALAGANYPVVSANVARRLGRAPTGDASFVPPWAILERQLVDGAGVRQPIRIGIIGFLPPQILHWDREHLAGRLATRDIVAAARAWVPQLREAGAELVIALAHSGIGPARHAPGMENAAVPLAALDGIDVVLTGHQHLVFPSPTFAGIPGVDAVRGTIHGKPAVMAGCWGDRLGVIDLLLAREGGVWRLLDHAVETRPIFRRDRGGAVASTVASAPEVLASTGEAHRATLAYIRRAVGRSPVPLHSYFALLADDPSLRLVNAAQAAYLRQMLAGGPHAGLPLLSAAAPFKAGGRGGPGHYTDVPAGEIAIKHVADLYLFPNTLRALCISGAELREWLERAAGLYNRVTRGMADQLLLNPDFPSYNFDVIAGVSYQIDPSQPSRYHPVTGALVAPRARRIRALRYRGRPVTAGQRFILATNSYRASGGGNFPGASAANLVFEGPDSAREAILRYLASASAAAPAPRSGPDPDPAPDAAPGSRADPASFSGWHLRPLGGGTSVLFETGPAALAYPAELAALKLEPAGSSPEGFARLRLRL